MPDIFVQDTIAVTCYDLSSVIKTQIYTIFSFSINVSKIRCHQAPNILLDHLLTETFKSFSHLIYYVKQLIIYKFRIVFFLSSFSWQNISDKIEVVHQFKLYDDGKEEPHCYCKCSQDKKDKIKRLTQKNTSHQPELAFCPGSFILTPLPHWYLLVSPYPF